MSEKQSRTSHYMDHFEIAETIFWQQMLKYLMKYKASEAENAFICTSR